MTDYIDRQAAIEALGERPVVWDEWTDEYTLGQRKQYDYDKLAIEALPSVEVEPVKHGRWIDMDDHVMCSCCGATHYGADKNYCPNCGAKMDEVEND